MCWERATPVALFFLITDPMSATGSGAVIGANFTE